MPEVVQVQEQATTMINTCTQGPPFEEEEKVEVEEEEKKTEDMLTEEQKAEFERLNGIVD